MCFSCANAFVWYQIRFASGGCVAICFAFPAICRHFWLKLRVVRVIFIRFTTLLLLFNKAATSLLPFTVTTASKHIYCAIVSFAPSTCVPLV